MNKNVLQETLAEIYDECQKTKFNGYYGDSLKDLVSSILHVYNDGSEVSEVGFQMEMLIEDIGVLMDDLAKAVAAKVQKTSD